MRPENKEHSAKNPFSPFPSSSMAKSASMFAEDHGFESLPAEILRRVQIQQVHLNLALEGGEVGLWDRDLQTGEIFWSHTLYFMLGRDLNQPVTEETFFGYLYEEDRPRVERRARQWFAEGGEFREEFRVVREDGQIRWFTSRGWVYRDEQHRPWRAVGVNFDVTDRKQAEEQTRSVAMFPEQNPNPVLRISLEGRLLYANIAARGVLAAMGYFPEGSLPSSVCDLIERAKQARNVVEAEWSDGQGRAYWFSASHPDHEPYVNLYGMDVTARKQAEEELKQRHLEVRKTNDELLRFNRAAVDREMRIIELKKQVNELLEQLGREPKYRTDFDLDE